MHVMTGYAASSMLHTYRASKCKMVKHRALFICELSPRPAHGLAYPRYVVPTYARATYAGRWASVAQRVPLRIRSVPIVLQVAQRVISREARTLVAGISILGRRSPALSLRPAPIVCAEMVNWNDPNVVLKDEGKPALSKVDSALTPCTVAVDLLQHVLGGICMQALFLTPMLSSLRILRTDGRLPVTSASISVFFPGARRYHALDGYDG
jgi:hypothetical protein